MIDHWWWRPGWSVGRQFYTWHLTFEDVPDVVRLVRAYDVRLDLPGLDLVPERWLHLTMQGVGFVDEVDRADVDTIVEAATTRLTAVEPFTITLGPAVVDPEVVRMRVNPVEPVTRLRRELRAAIAEVWGRGHVPEDEAGFTPHVSLAYSNRDGDMRPVLNAATAISPNPGTATMTHADLIVLNRDNRQYEWTPHARIRLGG
ncbi:MAG: 2'-5' RNA ligase family protein [Actinobacteria bacterium]|nr:2'-5' RNA ligase family protein [Actinomycetota bacterium]MBI3688326.1 2'-5' RNA ligase family protein [Actinomycetota bacterium]